MNTRTHNHDIHPGRTPKYTLDNLAARLVLGDDEMSSFGYSSCCDEAKSVSKGSVLSRSDET